MTESGGGGSDSWITHTDPVLETIQAKPPVGVWWTDPDLGGKIMRLHDFMEQGARGFHVYSDMNVFSANMMYYSLKVDDDINIYNWPDRTLKRRDIGIPATYFFSTVDDDIIYWLSSDSLMQYSISNDVKSVVHDFSDDFPGGVRNSGIKSTTDNGRYMAIPGNLADGSGGCLRYDFQTDSTDPIATTGSSSECGISPDGDYLLPLRGRGLGGGTEEGTGGGIECWDASTGAYIRSLDNGANSPHSDVIKDSNGVQWIVYQYSLGGKLRKVSIPDGEIVDLLDIGYMPLHISSNQKNGDWVIVSTYPRPEKQGEPFASEIVRVYLDSTKDNPHIERMAHHRTRAVAYGGSPTCYRKNPHASVSPDGNYVMFASSWGEECKVEPKDKVDPYVLKLDESGTTSPPPDPTPPDTLPPAAPTGLTISN
jgi:hypothetical protein